MMNLGDKVSVTLEITGEVVGRTFEGDPKVDLKLPWGVLNGIPLSVIKRREDDQTTAAAKVAANVTEIREAARKHRKVAATG